MKKIKGLATQQGNMLCEIKNVVEAKEDNGILTVSGYANKAYDEAGTELVDRDGDIILPQAYDLANFKKNPIILYQHRSDEPIGKAIAINVTSKGLELTAEIYKDMHPAAFTAVKAGILKTFSIGFRGKDGKYNADTDTFYYTEVELMETSIVSVPANADALFSIVDSPCTDGLCMFGISGLTEKGYDTIKNTSGKEWKDVDKGQLKKAAEKSTDEEYIKDLYLLVKDVEDSATFKFPHHELDGEDLKVNVGGLASALSAIKGAIKEDSLNIDEKESALLHLEKHYKDLVNNDIISEVPKELELLIGDATSEQKEIKGLVDELTSTIDRLNEAVAGIQQETDDDSQEDDKSEGDGDDDSEGDGDDADGKVSLEDSMAALRGSLNSDNLDDVIVFYEEFGDSLNEEINNRINSEE